MKSLFLLLCLIFSLNLLSQTVIHTKAEKIIVKEILAIKPDTIFYTILNQDKTIDTLKIETAIVRTFTIDKVEIDMSFINSFYSEIDELSLFDQGMNDAKKRYKTNFGVKILSFGASFYLIFFPILSDYFGASIVLAKYGSDIPNEGNLMLPNKYPKSQYYMKGYEEKVMLRRRRTAWISFHTGMIVKYSMIVGLILSL